MLVSFFLALGEIWPYEPWFVASITNAVFYLKWPDTLRYVSLVLVNGQLTLNLRGGVLSKWTKLCNSIAKPGSFGDGRSKLACVWCPVSIVKNKVFMENDRTAYKIQVVYDPKWSTKYKSRWWHFIEIDKTVDFKSLTFFFLSSFWDLALCTTVCSNHYKCVFLLEMTRHTEILITCVR